MAGQKRKKTDAQKQKCLNYGDLLMWRECPPLFMLLTEYVPRLAQLFYFFSPESWKIVGRSRDDDTQQVVNRRFGSNGNGSVFQSPLTAK